MVNYDPSMADDVAEYLSDNGMGNVGRDIFVNNPPVNKNSFFLITDTGGAAPEQYYALDHPSVQVAYYGASGGSNAHAKAVQQIWDAYHLLNRKQNIDIGSRDAMYSRAVATPQNIGLDPEKKRWLWVFNVMFKIRGVDGQ